MRTFKFEMGGSYVFYGGETLGDAFVAFVTHRPNRLKDITAITEEVRTRPIIKDPKSMTALDAFAITVSTISIIISIFTLYMSGFFR